MAMKTGLVVVMAISTVGLSGCSSMWNGVGSFSGYMAEKTEWVKFPSLRGSNKAKANDVQMVEAAPTATELRASSVSEIIDDSGSDYTFTPSSSASYSDTSSTTVPCPDGTYLTEDNVCMLLGGDDISADFDSTMDYSASSYGQDYSTAAQVVDNSAVPCPDGTYLNDKNQCMFLEQDDNTALFTQ